MKHLRRLMILFSLALAVLVMCAARSAMHRSVRVPALEGDARTLLRIWITGSPGGAQAWLTGQLRQWEKRHPGTMTYLRTVSPEELTAQGSVLPDVVLFMPGDLDDPTRLFTPLSGTFDAREELLRAGRWRGEQYGLPLCWGAWVLAIDGALEPGSAATPAPTTLLGRPAATAAPSAVPGYPLSAASEAACALQSPGGTALLSLLTLLPAGDHPPLPQDFAQLPPAEVYRAWQSRQCATAMLTTGQAVAFTALAGSGHGFPFRLMTPPEVITDQVWFAGVTPDAPPEAAALLSFLSSRESQEALAAQGLHTVRDDLTLYASGFSAEVEAAASLALSAVNAFLPARQVLDAAWQAFSGGSSLSQALLPLM